VLTTIPIYCHIFPVKFVMIKDMRVIKTLHSNRQNFALFLASSVNKKLFDRFHYDSRSHKKKKNT